MIKKRKKKVVWALIIAVIFLSIFMLKYGIKDEKNQAGHISTNADACENWGLSFQEEAKAPVGNRDASFLKKYNSYYINEDVLKKGQTKDIYLTFDAGYENGNTTKILDVLKEKKVPAAFFLVGNYLKDEPLLVRRMVAEGHIVGNHTMHHPDMSEISDIKAFEEELSQFEKLYEEILGEKLEPFYRPPQGKFSEKNLMHAKKLGYYTIFWSLAYVDWIEDKQVDEVEALNLLNKRIHPGAIVLLHSTSKTNSKILGRLIDDWHKKGYTFKSIKELCDFASKN